MKKCRQCRHNHYTELLSIDCLNKLLYYLSECINQNLSVRELREQIKNNEYERLDEETKKKIRIKEELKVSDLVKN